MTFYIPQPIESSRDILRYSINSVNEDLTSQTGVVAVKSIYSFPPNK